MINYKWINMKKGIVLATWVVLVVCGLNRAAAQNGLYMVKNAERLASERLAEQMASSASVTSEENEHNGLSPENTEVANVELGDVLATYLMENIPSTELTAAMGVPQRVEITDKEIVFTTECGDTVRVFNVMMTEAIPSQSDGRWVLNCENDEQMVLYWRKDCGFVMDVPGIRRLELAKIR